MTKIKVCGLASKADLRWCAVAGADILGLVVEYPVPVPWNLDQPQAKALLTQMPPGAASCIVTGGSVRQVTALAEALRPNMVQLHYRETVVETADITRRLAKLGIGVIKAIAPETGQSWAGFLARAQAFAGTGVQALLLDSRTADNAAVMGKRQLDLSLYQRLRQVLACPLWLAGGLNATNIGQIVRTCQPDGVDVLTGVEAAPGQKDRDKIITFIQQVRAYEQLER